MTLRALGRAAFERVKTALGRQDESQLSVALVKTGIQKAEKTLLKNIEPTFADKIQKVRDVASAVWEVITSFFSQKAKDRFWHTWANNPISPKAANEIIQAIEALKSLKLGKNYGQAVKEIEDNEDRTQAHDKLIALLEKKDALRTQLVNPSPTANAQAGNCRLQIKNLTPQENKGSLRTDFDLLWGI